MTRLAVAVVAACITFATASAQEYGDPKAGAVVAVKACSQCHAVLPGQGVSLDPQALPFEANGEALPFEDIANTPGVTAMALFAWLTSSHPTMPNMALEADELRNVVAYILSLEDRTRP